MKTEKIDIGEMVLCDLCNTDFSEGKEAAGERGGFIYLSKGVCPRCAPDFYKLIKQYDEQEHIKALCPTTKTFREFILEKRGGNHYVTITTAEKGENISDLLK